jgi:diguanylate cyclase (GGDEF)-like protein
MYARPIGLALATTCGVAAGSVGAALTQVYWLEITCLLMIIVAIARIALAFAQRRIDGRAGGVIRAIYPFGALTYATIVGAAAAIALLTPAETQLQVLLVSYAMTLGTGVAVGNAGRPMIVVGQIILTLMPVSLACLALGTLPMVTMAIILPALCVGLTYVAFSMFNALARQACAAADNERLAGEMQRQSCTDPITGLANRQGFEMAARHLLDTRTDSDSVALFWLDLHRFKDINDMWGHQVGDQVLQAVGERLRRRAPAGAAIARFGSDEFLMLAPLSSFQAIEATTGLLSADHAVALRVNGLRVECGASIGVAVLGLDSPDLDRLMQHAGLALHYAKLAGRNQVCFFNQGMTRERVHHKELEIELREALRRDELSIYFQPIVDLDTGRIRKFEALVRWFHAEKGELAPAEFIPVAEESGLIITLGNWITRTAARVAAHWPEHITLAVNLSPVQIHAPGASLGILSALRDAGLSPSRLELEVTESLFMEDSAESALFIRQLAAEGVRFALDDFGTGYSSLQYINKYPFSTIKVDRSFVSGPLIGRHSQAIIRAVAEMGATLDMEIVAEGLETAEQVETVRSAGCTLGQGYHFSRAVPEHMAMHLLLDEAAPQLPELRVG